MPLRNYLLTHAHCIYEFSFITKFLKNVCCLGLSAFFPSLFWPRKKAKSPPVPACMFIRIQVLTCVMDCDAVAAPGLHHSDDAKFMYRSGGTWMITIRKAPFRIPLHQRLRRKFSEEWASLSN